MSSAIMHNFWIAIEVMGLGMLGIFVVILAIMGCVVLLTKFGGGTKSTDEE